MRHKNISVLTLCSFAFLANAEVITGNGYPMDYLEFPEDAPAGGFVEDLGLYFRGFNTFAGSGYTNYLLVGDADSPVRTLSFLHSLDSSGIFTTEYFTESQSLMENSGSSGALLLALENSGFWEYAGAEGETIYIGFTVETNIGPTVETNYGFLQLLHETELDYRVMGWAYETTAGADLVTFDIVPAPSALALLSVSGLVAARRRRS